MAHPATLAELVAAIWRYEPGVLALVMRLVFVPCTKDPDGKHTHVLALPSLESKAIVRGAFWPSKNLVWVRMHPSIAIINGAAFDGCSNLAGVTFSQSLAEIHTAAFSGCTALTTVVFPRTVTHIGGSAFQGCERLSTIVLPSALAYIGSSAFEGCAKRAQVWAPDSLYYLPTDAFPRHARVTWSPRTRSRQSIQAAP